MPECGSGKEKVMTSKLEITYYNPPWDFLAYVETEKNHIARCWKPCLQLKLW